VMLAVAAIAVTGVTAAATNVVMPNLRLAGDWSVAVAGGDGCPTGDDGADSMPLAWVNPMKDISTSSYFISAVSQGIHPMVGPSLHRLTRQCGKPIFNSTFTQIPETYANFQWLQSVRVSLCFRMCTAQLPTNHNLPGVALVEKSDTHYTVHTHTRPHSSPPPCHPPPHVAPRCMPTVQASGWCTTSSNQSSIQTPPNTAPVTTMTTKTRAILTWLNVRCGFSTDLCTGGVSLSFAPLLRLRHCHACDQWLGCTFL
jgi:hypothetical protein